MFRLFRKGVVLRSACRFVCQKRLQGSLQFFLGMNPFLNGLDIQQFIRHLVRLHPVDQIAEKLPVPPLAVDLLMLLEPFISGPFISDPLRFHIFPAGADNNHDPGREQRGENIRFKLLPGRRTSLLGIENPESQFIPDIAIQFICLGAIRSVFPLIPLFDTDKDIIPHFLAKPAVFFQCPVYNLELCRIICFLLLCLKAVEQPFSVLDLRRIPQIRIQNGRNPVAFIIQLIFYTVMAKNNPPANLRIIAAVDQYLTVIVFCFIKLSFELIAFGLTVELGNFIQFLLVPAFFKVFDRGLCFISIAPQFFQLPVPLLVLFCKPVKRFPDPVQASAVLLVRLLKPCFQFGFKIG